MKTSVADLYAIGYYQEIDNQFFSQFARNFTTCDMYFPSILAPTFPNRIFNCAGRRIAWMTVNRCVRTRRSSTTARRRVSAAGTTTAMFHF